MKIKSLCIFITSISIIGRIIYIAAIHLTNSNIPPASMGFAILLVIYGIYLMIANKLKKIKTIAFLPYILCNEAAVILNIIICRSQNKFYFNIWEIGIIGGIWDILINGVLAFLILADHRIYENKAKDIEKF